MRKVFSVLIATAGLMLAQVAAAELKIAVVDVNEAVGQTREAQAFLERVQEQLAPDQETIRELTAEKSRIEERVERDGEVMSDEERVRLSEEYERVTNDLQYRVESYQRSINRRRQELFRDMGPRVQAALNDIVAADGFELIIPAGAVIYVDQAYDITRRLAEKLDEQG